MRVIRRRLSWLAVVWLTCQTAGLAAAPVMAMFGHPEDDCCPGVGPGQTCPMHHSREGDRKGDRTCKMRSACPRGDAALVSFAGGLGVLSEPTDVVTPFVVGDSVRALALTAVARASRPESPPPRS